MVKRYWKAGLVALGALALVAIGVARSGHKDIEQREFEGHGFKLRAVIRHDNWCNVFCPPHFVLESMTGEKWTPIARLGSDDPHPLEEKYVRILNDKVAYAWFHSEVVMTTDGGQHWQKWAPANKFSVDEPWIKEFQTAGDGSGIMMLVGPEKERTLTTRDYWQTATVTETRKRL